MTVDRSVILSMISEFQESQFCISITPDAVKELNKALWKGQSATSSCDRWKICRECMVIQVNEVKAKGENMMYEIMKTSSQSIRLTLGWQESIQHIQPFRSLEEIPPPYGMKAPSKMNSVCFLLRSSTDGSIIKSIMGYQNGEKWHQVWSSSPQENKKFEEARLLYDHVFFVFLIQREGWASIWGVARMSSPGDAKEYGPPTFWSWSEHDAHLWKWLGSNFKIEWLCQLQEKLNSHRLPQELDGQSIREYFRGKSDGHELGEEWWDLVQALLRCPKRPHSRCTPWWTTPSDGTQNYQEHVPRKHCEGYDRRNRFSEWRSHAQEPPQ